MIPTHIVPARTSNDLGNANVSESLTITTSDPSVETLPRKAGVSPANSPRLVSRPVSDETPIPFWRTSLNQAIRELFSQSVGRLASAGMFTALRGSNMPAAPAIVMGAMSAGYCAGQLLQHQIGTASTAQKVGVGIASVTAMVDGGVITGYASMPTACIIASGSFIAAVASSATISSHGLGIETTTEAEPEIDSETEPESEPEYQRCPDENLALGYKIIGFTSASTPILIGFLVNPSFWMSHDAAIGPRNFSVMVEALSVELAKATVSTVGISVNKDALVFEERFKTAMMGLLPYVISSVLLNSVVGSLLQAELESDQFTHLIVPALVGVFANCIKGAANAAAARYLNDPDATFLQAGNQTTRAHQGLQWPINAQLTPKVMLRYLMISCRDSLFIGMKNAGVRPEIANALSMAIYAGFSQFRELTFDLMQGQGWTQPTLRTGPPVDV